MHALSRIYRSTLAFKARLSTLMLALPAITVLAFASVPVAHAEPDFNPASIPPDMVLIGNVGNTADANGNGKVDYNYYIGTTEVTNAQYALFLNSVAKSDPYGLYDDRMGATYAENRSDERGGITRSGESGSFLYTVIDGWANKPVNYVTYYDALRFCNWLTNGADAAAPTETGMYTLANGTSVARNVNEWLAFGYSLPSEDEWYKAAYYNSTSGQYTPYATGETYVGLSHYNMGWQAGLAEVGSYAPEQNGTYDMIGNVQEWNDVGGIAAGNSRRVRGGRFYTDYNDTAHKDKANVYATSDRGSSHTGFRIAQLASIPEPSTYGLIGGAAALLGAVALRRRLRRD